MEYRLKVNSKKRGQFQISSHFLGKIKILSDSIFFFWMYIGYINNYIFPKLGTLISSILFIKLAGLDCKHSLICVTMSKSNHSHIPFSWLHYYSHCLFLMIYTALSIRIICDPFWHNESEVAESRTEIWASEVGIGSKNGKRLFSIFSILDISRFISQNFKPQPPPQVPQTEL